MISLFYEVITIAQRLLLADTYNIHLSVVILETITGNTHDIKIVSSQTPNLDIVQKVLDIVQKALDIVQKQCEQLKEKQKDLQYKSMNES